MSDFLVNSGGRDNCPLHFPIHGPTGTSEPSGSFFCVDSEAMKDRYPWVNWPLTDQSSQRWKPDLASPAL
jgi:hypothetical protein